MPAEVVAGVDPEFHVWVRTVTVLLNRVDRCLERAVLFGGKRRRDHGGASGDASCAVDECSRVVPITRTGGTDSFVERGWIVDDRIGQRAVLGR